MTEYTDTDRLRYLMEEEAVNYFLNVSKNLYEYENIVARKNGRECPTDDDSLEAFRRMVDCAMDGGDTEGVGTLRLSDWIPWCGGERPVPTGVDVVVMLRNGEEFNEREEKVPLHWMHMYGSGDIVAYRVVG